MKVDHQAQVRPRGLYIWSHDYPDYTQRLHAMGELAVVAFENAALIDLIPLHAGPAPRDHTPLVRDAFDWNI